jgi:nitroreductase
LKQQLGHRQLATSNLGDLSSFENQRPLRNSAEQHSYSTQNQVFVEKAKVVIVVCSDLNIYKTFPHKERALSLFTVQETAAATQNLLLAAHAMGLGACWVSLFSDEQVREALNLSKGIRPVVIVPLGHTKSKTKPKPRRPLKDVVKYETF